MKRILALVTLALALPLAACQDTTGTDSAEAPITEQASDVTAASLVQKHLAAIGGEDRIRSIESEHDGKKTRLEIQEISFDKPIDAAMFQRPEAAR